MAEVGDANRQDVVIPDRVFFRIGDVSQIAGVETHVLRFWESEFPTLNPRKTKSGQRQYRRKDVATVLKIKRLLYEDGYTIAGARKALRKPPKSEPEGRCTEAVGDGTALSGGGRIPSEALQEIRSRLQQILALLSP